MGISNFPGGADPSETLSYIANSGGVFSDSVTLPSNRRQAMDGSRPIWVYRVRVHGSGRGGSRSLRVGIANGRSNYITVGSAGSAQNTGWIGIGLASYGGNFRVLIEANGSFYFGRASSGGATTIVGNSSPSWDGSIAGICEWCESPTAPRSASATLISTTTARISWAAPSDNGGAAISNYRIYRSTSPSMSNSSQVTVGGSVTSYDWGGLAAGETYYFLVRAMNLATNGVGLASVGSAVVSAQTGTVPGAPTTVAADAGPGYFGLTWQPPASDGGVAISGYKVQFGDQDDARDCRPEASCIRGVGADAQWSGEGRPRRDPIDARWSNNALLGRRRHARARLYPGALPRRGRVGHLLPLRSRRAMGSSSAQAALLDAPTRLTRSTSRRRAVLGCRGVC